MKKHFSKAISFIAAITLLVSIAVPFKAAAAAPSGNIVLVVATSFAEGAGTITVPVTPGTTQYSVDIPTGATYVIVKSIPYLVGDTVAATVDGSATIKGGGAYTYPTDKTGNVLASASSNGFAIATTKSSFTLAVSTTSVNASDSTAYTITLNRTAAREVKFLDDVVTNYTDNKYDIAGMYIARYKALSAENRAKITNHAYYGSDIVVRTGTTSLNLDTAVVSAYYPATETAVAKAGEGTIDLPNGSTRFSIASIDGVSNGITYTVGGATYNLGAYAPAVPASGTVITVTNGTKTYNLNVTFSVAAEVAYLEKVIDEFYTPENIDSLASVASFVLDIRTNALSEENKTAVINHEAGVIETTLTKYRTAKAISKGALDSLKARYATLTTTAKALISAANVTYLNTAVPVVATPTATATAKSTPTAAPSNPDLGVATLKSVSLTSNSTAVITWSAVSKATGYKVFRQINSGAFVEIKSTTATSYKNTKLAAGKKYTYKVVAYDAKGVGAASETKSVTTLKTKKFKVSVKSSVKKTIALSWAKVTGAAGYEVQRSLKSATTSFKKIATTKAISYKNAGLKSKTKYYYRVRGYKSINKATVYTAWSNVVVAKSK